MIKAIINLLFGRDSSNEIISHEKEKVRPLQQLPFPKIPEHELVKLFQLRLQEYQNKIRAICNKSNLYKCVEEVDTIVDDYTRSWLRNIAEHQPKLFSNNEKLTQMSEFVDICMQIAESRGANRLKYENDAGEIFRNKWRDKYLKEQDEYSEEFLDDILENYVRAKRPDKFH